MKVVVFAGAGVSAELGVPAMRPMAEAFLGHVRDGGYPAALVDVVAQLLEDSSFDMEQLIDDLDTLARAAQASARWQRTPTAETGDVESLRKEAEWFVSHTCERVNQRAAYRLWHPTLRAAVAGQVDIATTNYDRAIELAGQQAGIQIADGFPPFVGNEMVEWCGFDDSPGIRLLKTHGSTNWYQDEEGGTTWKLRHAMPLFGSVRVSVQAESQRQLRSALVLPAREKSITSSPYPELSYLVQDAIHQSDAVCFVGSSLRDPELLAFAGNAESDGKLTLVVGRTPRTDVGKPVEMSASRFLVSVLPQLMSAESPDSATDILDRHDGHTESVLDRLDLALNKGTSVDERLESIDWLCDVRLALQDHEIRELLTDDSEEVRSYALGLVRDSPAREGLLGEVRDLASQAPGTQFAREAGLLSTIPG